MRQHPANYGALGETPALLRGIQSRLTQPPLSFLLVKRLKARNPDVQAQAVRLLSRRGEFFKEAEPLLLQHLQSTNSAIAENAAIALKNYGAEAYNTLPALRWLQYPDKRVRTEVFNAIMRVSALTKDRMRRE
jgi:HEAT repeat protein